jgi:hypothetical protein
MVLGQRSSGDGMTRRLMAGLPWLAAACLVLGTAYSALSTPDELPDPLPLRRVLLPPERVPEEMKRLGQGLLRQLPRDDFEDLVRRAARGSEAARKVPRLVAAHYRARLVNTDLTGTAQWDIINPAAGPAVLPLPTLNLALRQPRFENRAALLGELDGKNLGLLLDDGGEHALAFDWSARGERRPEGLAFALELPPAPVATLEVQAPADSVVAVASDGCLLSGPGPADAPDQRLWTVAFAGHSQVRLVVRKDDGPNPPPPLVLAGLFSRQRLTPDAVDAEFTFDLKVLHHGVRELRCECDPGLRPYSVQLGKPSEDALRSLDTWEFQEGAAPALVVRLPEPFQGGTLQVHALAPLGGGGGPVAWTCPGLRLAQAVPRGETLELHLHPDVYLEQWQPGGFRLTQARAEADGGQVLTLTGGGLTGAGQHRPSARLLTSGADLRAREVLWWQVAPALPAEAGAPPGPSSSLTVLLTYDVVRGHLFQLPVALPPGWDVDRLQLDPPELLRNWGPRMEGGRTVLVVDLQRPVSPGPAARPDAPRPGLAEARPAAGPVRLSVWLRPAAGRGPAADRGAAGALSYPFPDVAPLGVRLREGALAIDLDESLYEARVDTPARGTTPGEDGPWGKQLPDYYFPYRGQPVQGTLTLQPRRPRLRARCTSAVGLTADRAAVETRLTLQPEVGTPETVDLYLSAPPAGRWQWKTEEGTNAVRSFERVPAVEAAPLLGAVGAPPLPAATLLAALARPPAGLRGERWRLTLARPLREPVTLAGTGELRRGGDRVDVPLPAVAGASRMEGEVKLYLAGANLVQVEAVGLRELQAPAGGRAGAPPPWRAFHYSQPPLALALRGQGAAPDRESRPVIDRAHLTTYAGPDGHLLLHYRLDLEGWRQPTLPLRLPGGARTLRARVDGRCLAQLPVADDSGAEGVLLELPVPIGPARHRYEVVYGLDRPGWALWASLEAPEPGLPVDLQPRALRRTWRLAPGVAPLLGGQDRLPGPARPPDTPAAWRQWAAGVCERWGPQEWLRRLALSNAGPDGWQAEQRQRLAEAGAEPGKARTLGEALERFLFDRLQDQEVLVLDVEALRDAGLGPATPLPADAVDAGRPFWEGAGLVHLPCRAAPLLTTRRQAEAWQYAAGQGTALSPSLAQAVAEAVLFGHDRSGRFATVMDWLGVAAGGDDADPSLPPQRLVPEPVGAGWTAWEPLAGTSGDESLLVVRQGAVPWWGGALAGLLALAFWRARYRPPRRRLILLVLWLAAAGLAVCWLPASLQALAWWPLLAGLVLAVGWYLRAVFARPPLPAPPGSRATAGSGRRAPSSWGPGAAGALLLLLLPPALALLPRGRAAGPDPVTVFLIPGPADAPEKQTVLAPPDLLKDLEALAHRGSPALRGPVLVAAEYRGEVRAEAEDAARFEAVLTVHAFTDEPGTLAFPLAGAQLEEALVDGARTSPLPAPPSGYALPVRGKGDHVATLRFRVPVQAFGADRDLQFTAPRAAQSRLTLTVPDGSRYLQALVKQGATTLDAGGTRLEVDLGQVPGPLHFRWRQEGGPPQAPAVQVQELYLWDLGVSSSSLTAVLRYTVERGAVTTLELELPGQLEVRNAEVAPLGAEEPAPRLKGYEDPGPAGDAPRRVRLDFQGPVAAGVQVLLDLVPRRPLDARQALPLPAPVGAEATTGYLAYRLDGLAGELKTFSGVKAIDLPDFARPWKLARGSAPPPLTYACIFGRKPAAPALGLDLRVQRPRLEAVQDLAWRVGPQQADLRATLRLTAPDADLGLVEWEVPENVTLARVTGPDVRHWSRSGSRLQVWLQRTVSSTELQLTGWWLTPAAAQNAKSKSQNPKSNPEAPFTFDLPHLGLPSAQAQTTFVRLTAAGGRALARLQGHGLDALPDPQTSDQERSYVALQPDYGGSFRVRPAAAGTDVRVLTVAEVRDRQVAFTAWVDCRPRQGELRTVEVRLADWDGEGVTLEGAPEGARVREHRATPGDRSWTVDLPAGFRDKVLLTLRGRLPLDEAAGGLPMPDVAVAESTRAERWLAVAGGELLAQDERGLTAVKDPAAALRPWPKEARRLRSEQPEVWRVTAADDWGLRLLPHDRAAGPAPVQVYLTEQVARVVDGRHWVHQATYWLYHEGSSDLRVTLPARANVLGASVDGAEVAPLAADPGGGSLWLPLPGGTGARQVCLRWAFPEGELIGRPDLERPRLAGVIDGPVVWGVHVPAGYAVEASARGPAPASRAWVELSRAEAQLRLSEKLAEKAHGQGDAFAAQLAAAQRRFYQSWRRAEHWLDTAGARAPLLKSAAWDGAARTAADGLGPRGQNLTDWLHELDERNAHLAPGSPEVEALRAEAKRQGRAGVAAGDAAPQAASPGRCAEDLDERGTPLSWQTADPVAPAPVLSLTAPQTRQTRRALGSSLLLAALLLGAWVLSTVPGVLSRLRALWPEQVVLLGGLAWLLFGAAPVGAALVLFGVAGRLVLLALRFWAWLWREAPAPAGGSASG